MGYERRNNLALQFDNREDFVAYMSEGQPTRPANVLNIVAINQGRLPLTMDMPQSVSLTAARISECIAEGHLVIDGRSPDSYGKGHIPKSFNIQLRSPEFEQRVGWVAPLDVPVVLVLEEEVDAEMALHKLAFLGLDQRVSGHLHGGIRSWASAGFEVESLTQASVQDVNSMLGKDPSLQVLDVRDPSEWESGHIKGAHYMSYKQIGDQIAQLDVSSDAPLAVVCGGGGRSSTACSILLQHGFKNLINTTGGMTAWNAAKLPVTKD